MDSMRNHLPRFIYLNYHPFCGLQWQACETGRVWGSYMLSILCYTFCTYINSACGSSQGWTLQLTSNVKANCCGLWPVSTHSFHRQPFVVPIFGVRESCSKEGKKYLGPTFLKSFSPFADVVSLLDTHQWGRQSSVDSIAHTFPVTTQCRHQHVEGTGKNNTFRWWPYVGGSVAAWHRVWFERKLWLLHGNT